MRLPEMTRHIFSFDKWGAEQGIDPALLYDDWNRLQDAVRVMLAALGEQICSDLVRAKEDRATVIAHAATAMGRKLADDPRFQYVPSFRHG